MLYIIKLPRPLPTISTFVSLPIELEMSIFVDTIEPIGVIAGTTIVVESGVTVGTEPDTVVVKELGVEVKPTA